ncbi:MAG: flippase [Gammaproteobacteria bacterium]
MRLTLPGNLDPLLLLLKFHSAAQRPQAQNTMAINDDSSLLSIIRKGGIGRQMAHGAIASTGLTIAKNFLLLAVSILLARMLEPTGYGQYAFAMSLAKVLSIFATLGLPWLLTREIAAGEAKEEWSFARGLTRHADQAVSLALVLIVSAGVTAVLLWPHLGREFRLTLILALIYLIFNSFGQLRGAQLMGFRRVIAGQIGILCVQPVLLLAAVLIIAYVIEIPLTSAIAFFLTAVAAFVVLVLNVVLAHQYHPPRWRNATPARSMPGWLKSAAPFGVMSGLFLVNSQIDLIMLGFFKPRDQVGLYQVAASGAAILPLILTALNPVLGPTMSRFHTLGDKAKLRRAARVGALVSLMGAAPIFLIFLFLGKTIIGVVFGAAYLGAWIPLIILSAGQFMNAAVGPVGLLLTMTGHEGETVRIMGVSTVLNIALNAALIPLFGMTGAATATAVSLFFWNVTLALRVRRRFGYFLTPLI